MLCECIPTSSCTATQSNSLQSLVDVADPKKTEMVAFLRYKGWLFCGGLRQVLSESCVISSNICSLSNHQMLLQAPT